MKLVIDIHKKDYQSILNSGQVPYGVVCAIMNGTPLPKGHGDLIDRNNLLEYTDINICAYTPAINRYEIITAPTIIKADEEG